jgi:uncharacterized protein (TIGR02271 family)
MLEHIVAVFKSDGPAAAAERALNEAGIPASAVRRYSTTDTTSGQTSTAEPASTGQSGGGFWSWLLGEDTPNRPDQDADKEYYERRARAGSTILSVTVADDSQIHRAVEIIESYDPLEIDERTEDENDASQASVAASTVGRDFSSSDTASATAGIGSGALAGGGLASGTQPMPSTATPSTMTGSAETRVGTGTDREETISLAEEQLEIGKRTVDRGTTRIRRYVVETPVERDVSLHSERVTVERRRPLDASAAPGAGSFEERTVEVRETEEIPVVQKTAHIAEEVVVHREATERTETVHDKVRREEVEITPGETNRTTKPDR